MTRFVRVRTMAAALGAYAAVFVTLSLASGGDNTRLGDLAQLVPPAVFASMCYLAATRSARGVRVFWNLNALHGSIWFAAQALWTYLELVQRRTIADASPSDPLFFAASMPLAAALYGRPDRERPRWLFNVVVLDIILITLFFVFIYLYLITALSVTGSPASFYAPSLTQLFNTRSVILAAWAGWVAMTADDPAWRKTLRLYFAAILSVGMGSAIANWAVDHGQYRTGSLYDLGWILPYSLLAIVPAYAFEQGASAPRETRTDETKPPLVSTIAIALLFGIPLTDAIVRLLSGAPHDLADVRTQLTVTMMIPFGVVVLAREVLWRRALARTGVELHSARSQLVQTEKLAAVGQLVSGMAHELNNPLQGVLGYTELMLATRKDEQTRDELRRIRDNANRAAGIVRNLLAFAGADRTSRSWHDMNQIVQRAVETRRYQLDLAGTRIAVRKAERLPFVYVDAAQLEKVFVNVLVNAEGAIRAGAARGGASASRGEISVATRLDNAGDHIVIEVSDNGSGIDPADLPRVFDPFFTTREVGDGAGLGLSYCYGIVREHGGDITVENLARGARFLIELPVRAADVADAGPPPELNAPDGRHVLVVDDDEANATLILRALEKLGYHVDSTTLSRRALVMVESADFDVVVADVKMPELSGSELYAAACAIKPQMRGRFVFVTGYALEPNTRRFLEGCGCQYFMKPFELDRLTSAIGRLVRRSAPADVH